MTQNRLLFWLILLGDAMLLGFGALVAANAVASGTFNELFSLDDEWTLPTTWSGFKLAFVGLLLWVSAMGMNTPRRRLGGFLCALVFLFLAFDELGGIHERGQVVVGKVMRLAGLTELSADGISWRGFAYSALLLPFVLYVAYWSSAFWRAFGPQRVTLFLGFGLLAFGSVVIDNFGSLVFSSPAAHHTLEEAAEFLGATVMLFAGLAALRAHPVRLTIGEAFVGEAAAASAAPADLVSSGLGRRMRMRREERLTRGASEATP